MTLSNWARITPQEVSNQMSFVEGDTDWTYKADQNHSMAAKQAEGVAYLCRLLHKHGLALLADEVGMGKTFQAIGVIRLLQQVKPDAKILVIAPNKGLCIQWIGEFDTFAKSHWRGDSAEPLKIAEPQSQLEGMVTLVAEEPHHVYFTTIHSFSGLASSENENDVKVELAERKAKKLKKRVMEALGGQGFDLLVIDEAHYLRNIEGGSQRVAAAKAFFGEGDEALAKQVLLMTATPTHSSVNDVANILGYFAPESELKNSVTQAPYDASELLTKYGLRRHRLLEGGSGRHYAKQHYRKEIAHSVSFSGNQNAELFFGLYQRQLVKEVQAKASNRQFLYGYLEGFESFGADKTKSEKDDGTESGSSNNDGFHEAQDTSLLNRLSQEYDKCFGVFPEHPKYKALVDHFVPNQLNHTELDNIKHLVFVRRIPSVRELTKRVNSRYDNVFGAQISAALKLSQEQQQEWQRTKWSRVWLNNQFKKEDASTDHLDFSNEKEDGADLDQSNNSDNYLRSRITELFVVKKRDEENPQETQNTVCTNIALRFRKPESIFSMFLEPALDYLEEDYPYFWEVQSGQRKRAMYATAAFYQRAKKYSFEVTDSKDDVEKKEEPLPTIWKYLVKKLNDKEKSTLNGWDPSTKENFANYFKAGVLFASPVMVELFCWLYRFDNDVSLHKRGESAQQRYEDFIEYSADQLSKSMLLWYFKAALTTFEDVCRKVARVALDNIENDWHELKAHSSPAAYASGESSNRENLQLGFNTPFYPNVLVATSVFQEGVNLHLQCNEVHHYGLAGSPGSHEQRVGRIDRLFGKVNRQYKEKEHSELKINFPYLEHSFDEDQLASFLERKMKADSKLDKCLMDDTDSRIGTEKAYDWKSYLKQPERAEDSTIEDPYPAIFSEEKE